MIEYCVDEAGDSVLWGRRGRLLVGTDGCSSFFMLGMVQIADPNHLSIAAEELRTQILADPWFRGVPSLDPARRKTALAFHAKDDLPEVRRDFFKLLLAHKITFHAVVRDKREVARIVDESRIVHPNYSYNQNQLYDDLARKLFYDKLHVADSYSIIFSRRWTSDRTHALQQALQRARDKHCLKNGISARAGIQVGAASPSARIELQVVDYYLWALQRAYERGEDRYLQLIWPQVHCVWDCDDTRQRRNGERYTKEKPLDAALILRNRQQI
jgi:hypothetical protein